MRDINFDRETLAAALPKLQGEVARRIAVYRAAGREGRVDGMTIHDCPLHPGSWTAVRWLEGWSDTIAPKREFEAVAFNMTPAEDVFLFTGWVLGLGLRPEVAQLYIDSRKRGYAAEALAGNA